MVITAKFKGKIEHDGYKKKDIYFLTMLIVNNEIHLHPRTEYLEAKSISYGSLKLLLLEWIIL